MDVGSRISVFIEKLPPRNNASMLEKATNFALFVMLILQKKKKKKIKKKERKKEERVEITFAQIFYVYDPVADPDLGYSIRQEGRTV